MEYWIWLTQIKGLGPIISKRLVNKFGTVKDIYDATEDELLSTVGIGRVLAKNIISSRSLDKANLIVEECLNKKIKILTYSEPLYPKIAKDYIEAPMVLFYKGNIKENVQGVSIVGSRKCSMYGKELAVRAAEFLASNDIPVISGMAKGIDGYAHTACLKKGGYTIAFLGNGVDICYPKEHDKLMQGIIEQGAVISEYPPNTTPRPEFFTKRNALISSWSKKVLVVEAAEKSGSLSTAATGKLLNREVLAAPHKIDSTSGKGNNKLILNGATIFLESSQLVIENKRFQETIIGDELKNISGFNIVKQEKKVNLTPLEENIINCINYYPKTVEEIASNLSVGQIELMECLSIMELEGKIRPLSAGRYATNYTKHR